MTENLSIYQDMGRFPEENPYPVMRLRRDGSVCYANSASDILLKYWRIHRGDVVPGIWLARVKQTLESGKITVQQEVIDRTTYSLALVPLQDNQYVNIYGQDISRLRRVLERLRQTRSRLEKTVERRTEQLNQTIQTLMSEVQERLQTETELQENQRRLKEAQRIAKIGSWEWNLLDNTLWWSDQVFTLWGYPPDSFVPSYDRFMESIHPEDRSKVQAAIDHSLQTGNGYTIEHRVIRADGTKRIVLERGEVLANNAGAPNCLRGTVQDITASNQQITTIENQSIQIDKQADLLDSAHDMITVFDLDGHLMYWNHGAEWTYGWTREEVNGKISHHLLKTEFSTPRAEIVSHILREGKWEGELIQHDRNGRRLSVESRWVLRRDSHGHPEAVLAIDRDITLRKQAEETVRQARDYAENIIATIQDALIVLDNSLQVISANESFYQTFALTPDKVVGTPIYHLPGGQWDQPELRRLLEDILPQKTQLRNFELAYSEPGHPDRCLLLNTRQMHSQVHPEELILLAIQDITQRKAQDRAIAAHERRLHALTEELLQAEEAQREKTALALHDSIGPALAFAKRELSALEKEATPDWRDNLRRVNRQIGQAIEQTRSLTTELSSPTLRMFGLEAALEELGDQFAIEHGLNCTTLYPEETIPITPNHRTFLYRSVRELLINIVKHAQATQVTICIQKDHEDIEISVQDNGRGFDPDTLKNSEANAIQGFGLFSIQERLGYIGGHFTLESTRHEGTRIVLRAPIADNRKGDCQHGKNHTRR